MNEHCMIYYISNKKLIHARNITMNDVNHVHNNELKEDQVQAAEQQPAEGNSEKCQQEIAEWRDRAMRINAEFENYKKRTERDREQWIKIAQSNILHDLLAIVDDFDRALATAHAQENAANNILVQGFELTKKSMDKLLAKYDVHEIKDNTIFNPEFHEAIMSVESPNHKHGDIVSVLQKGYMLKDQVLRPGKVSVAQ